METGSCLENLDIESIGILLPVNNKGADQRVQMSRLICTIGVYISIKIGFLMIALYFSLQKSRKYLKL